MRLAEPQERADVANLWLRSRKDSDNPPCVHDDDDVRRYFQSLPDPIWVAVEAHEVCGMMVIRGDWIDHLHVEPRHRNRGVGTRLLEHTDAHHLWTFQSNVRARRFYERHGFAAVAYTEGDNEEGAPDVHYAR